jgi:hypothetical protein
MKRREFITLLSGALANGLPFRAGPALAQGGPLPAPAPAAGVADNSVGQVATLQGMATVTRANAAAPLRVSDHIFEKDVLQTGLNSTLGVTFDDETTFSLSPNTRIAVDQFVYEEGSTTNSASINVGVGTAAFVASLVAKTGDMKITTANATLGIRGTTGVVDVPEGGGATAPTIKLYADTDGHVGQIDVFDRQGGRLGALTQGASAFSLRLGPGGRLAAVPYRIPPQEAARDRGVLTRLSVSHAVGRQIAVQRRQQRALNPRQPNNGRFPGQPNNGRFPGQPNNGRLPNGPQNNGRFPGGEQNRGLGGQQLNPRFPGGQPLNRPFRGGGQPRPKQRFPNGGGGNKRK